MAKTRGAGLWTREGSCSAVRIFTWLIRVSSRRLRESTRRGRSWRCRIVCRHNWPILWADFPLLLLTNVGNFHRSFQRGAVPFAQIGGRLICALQKSHQRLIRLFCPSYDFVRQNELFHHWVVVSLVGLRAPAGEPIRLWVSVGIEDRYGRGVAARPEPGAADFVRVGFADDKIRGVRHALMFGRASPGKSRHCQIEAPPEKMNRAALADEPRPEPLHHAVSLRQREPEEMRMLAVVRRVF